MKKTIFYLLIGVSVCLSACGGKGKANRDKEIQDSTRKADSLAKIAVWQNFITPIKEIKLDEFQRQSNIVELKKEQVKVLESAGFLTPSANKFWSYGKTTSNKMFLVHLAEKFNERTENNIVICDTKCYMLTFDKSGNLLDKLFIEKDITSDKNIRLSHFKVKDNVLSIESSDGSMDDKGDFVGEKITYQIDSNGKFKEVSRKKQ